jgi:hypothetical protein
VLCDILAEILATTGFYVTKSLFGEVLGDAEPDGAQNSVRTDVVMRDGSGNVIAVWDVKTGGARLDMARVLQIRLRLRIDDSVPVMEIQLRKREVIPR